MQREAPEAFEDLPREQQDPGSLRHQHASPDTVRPAVPMARSGSVERGVLRATLRRTCQQCLGPPQWSQSELASLLCRCRSADRALLIDLKARGLLDDPLVLWGGEWPHPTAARARRPRHHPSALRWLAGGASGRHDLRRPRTNSAGIPRTTSPRARPARHDPAPDGH